MLKENVETNTKGQNTKEFGDGIVLIDGKNIYFTFKQFVQPGYNRHYSMSP